MEFSAARETERSRFLLTWLGWRDSNPLYRSQSPVCYHYTTSHYSPVVKRKRIGIAPNPILLWGGIWGSNPRHPEPQSGALPTELIPPYCPEPFGAGAPGGTRTPGLLLRRQLLYPAELLALIEQPSEMERVRGIGPPYPAWKAGILPLNYTRKPVNNTIHRAECQVSRRRKA